MTMGLSQQSGAEITWVVHSATEFPNGVDDLAAAVVNEDCWVAVASELPPAAGILRHIDCISQRWGHGTAQRRTRFRGFGL